MLSNSVNERLLQVLLIAGQVVGTNAVQPWSQRMVDGIILREQGAVSSSVSTSTIASGLLALALNSAVEQYPQLDPTYSDYAQRVLNVASSNLINATAAARLPLDRFSIANAIQTHPQKNISALTKNETEALKALDDSFHLQPRNFLGGLWYYASYPEWSYLDGMFSALPYLALSQSPNLTDVDLQISLLSSHCWDSHSRLLVHGYDASRTAVWANRDSGASPYVWGRSLGWFMLALIQTHEYLCQNTETSLDTKQLCLTISSQFTGLVFGLLPYADEDTGAWFQLTTFPNRSGNWLESSSTCLFIFAILKGLRAGLLPTSSEQVNMVRRTALKAFKFTTSSGQFIQDLGNGTLAFNGTVTVCSLNSTASYEYYTGRPVEYNSLIGEAAFVLAALEVEKLDAQI